jgi:hypothetical protein
MHTTEEMLHAHVDRELDSDQTRFVSDHLTQCAECSNLFSKLQERSNLIREKLEILDGPPEVSSEMLLQRIQSGNQSQETKIVPSRFKSVWASAAAILLVFAAWQFHAVRVWATEFLNLFRVQQIAVVPIDPANVRQWNKQFFDSPENRPRLEQLFSDQVHVIKQGTPQNVASANDAAKVAGFGVRLPGQLSGPMQLKTQPEMDVSVRIDVEKVQSILDDAGRNDIRIPQELDGQLVNFHVPSSVTALYGKCPDLQAEQQKNSHENRDDDEHENRMMQKYPDCKLVVQLPSPSVVAPPSLNISQLGQAMLQLAGLPENEARKFAEKIDWSSTLVIPLQLDRNMKFSDVTVDGVQGTLFSSEDLGRYRTAAYNLMWIRDGILYCVMGQGKSDEAIAIANNMQ